MELAGFQFELSGINILTASPCVDDATGAYSAMGGCATVLSWGTACTATFAGSLVSGECPVSCSACPGTCGDGIYDWDETGIPEVAGTPMNDGDVYADGSGIVYCSADVPGCSLSDKQLRLVSVDTDASLLNGTTLPAGAVVYNSSANIAGWQFDIQGATVTGASGGEATLAGNNISFNATFGTVLGYASDPTTGYVPAGCGVLIVAGITGTATGLSEADARLVFSDSNLSTVLIYDSIF